MNSYAAPNYAMPMPQQPMAYPVPYNAYVAPGYANPYANPYPNPTRRCLTLSLCHRP